MDSFPDPQDLRLSIEVDGQERAPRRRPPRHRPGQKFLKGPIPWDWLDRAGRLPGRALAVGLVLWQRAGVQRSRTVRLCQASVAEMGLNEDAVRRGIRRLEGERLIEVARMAGRGLEVTILEVEGHSTKGDER